MDNSNHIKNVRVLSSIVCYKNEDEVIDYCKMLFGLRRSDEIGVIVAINALSDSYTYEQFIARLHAVSDKIVTCRAETNLGYLNGMLYGYNEYLADKKPVDCIDWVMMGNTDIVIQDKNFVDYITNKEYPEDVVCVAPCIHRLNPDGYEKHYEQRYSKRKLTFLWLVNKVEILSYIYKGLCSFRRKHAAEADPASKKIYEAHGSFFLIKASFMETLSKYHWPCVMYNEEGFISRVVLSAGKCEFYDANLKVDHFGSTTTKLLLNSERRKMLCDSYAYLLSVYDEM